MAPKSVTAAIKLCYLLIGAMMMFVPAPGHSAILVCAGDIAESGGRQLQTSNLLLDYINGNASTRVCTAGDNAYPSGRATDFGAYYQPTWGRSAIKSRTFPTPGNHDYATSGAQGYYTYFGSIAAQSAGGFYVRSLDANWVGIFMNSEAGISSQTSRLRTALVNAGNRNVLLVWHKPRFAIGSKGNVAALAPWWQLADDFDVDLIITAHEHFYARVPRRRASGAVSSIGTPEFVVGTGGAHLRSCSNTIPGTRCISRHGVTRFRLTATEIIWEFRTASGILDSGRMPILP